MSLRSDINNLIMNYLVTEGYPSAARNFAKEANIQPNTEFESINERVEIRDLIYKGDLQTAIEKINELNPQVCLPTCRTHWLSFSLYMISLVFMHHS